MRLVAAMIQLLGDAGWAALAFAVPAAVGVFTEFVVKKRYPEHQRVAAVIGIVVGACAALLLEIMRQLSTSPKGNR